MSWHRADKEIHLCFDYTYIWWPRRFLYGGQYFIISDMIAVFSRAISTSHMHLHSSLNKLNLKSSFWVTLTTCSMLNCHVWQGAAILGSTDLEHFHHCRKFLWMATLKAVSRSWFLKVTETFSQPLSNNNVGWYSSWMKKPVSLVEKVHFVNRRKKTL